MRMKVMNVFEVKRFKKRKRISKKAVDNDNVLIHFTSTPPTLRFNFTNMPTP